MEKKVPGIPMIIPDQLTGDEPICDNTTLLDYWCWAHSNLVDNTERGVLRGVSGAYGGWRGVQNQGELGKV